MSRLRQIVLVLVAALCFWGASAVHARLLARRLASSPTSEVVLANASPLMVFTTVALGGFRGLMVDGLWVRAWGLQREGKFLELVQLADWITTLEPHFPAVWAYHAWNLAYNVSLYFPDPEDRWRWVQQGLHLLRDEGLRHNPADPALYRELAWIYQHKIGYVMDSAHPTYKRELAREIEGLFGGPHPPADPADPRWVRIRAEARLEPAQVLAVDAEFGPLDWRSADAHALYWATLGRRYADGRPAAAPEPTRHTSGCGHDHGAPAGSPNVGRQLDQLIARSAANAFMQGRLDLGAEPGRVIATPSLALLPKARQAFEAALARHELPTLREAYSQFLGEAAVVLHCYGRDAEARATYAEGLRRFPGSAADASFDAFVARVLAISPLDLSPEDAMAMVEGPLYRAWRARLAGDATRATADETRAGQRWSAHEASRLNEDHRLRTGLPPLAVIRRLALDRALAELAPADAARLKALAAEPAPR